MNRNGSRVFRDQVLEHGIHGRARRNEHDDARGRRERVHLDGGLRAQCVEAALRARVDTFWNFFEECFLEYLRASVQSLSAPQ